MTVLQPSDIIEKLKIQRVGHQYTGISISELPIYLAIDKNDWFALVVPAADRVNQQHLSTDFITLRLGAACTISAEGNIVQTQRFHILQCKTTDDTLIEMFIILCQALAKEIQELTNVANSMINFFNSLTQLFRVTPATDLTLERQGLWGELFILKHTGDITTFSKFWHSEPTRKFDFSHGNRRLEVKTTTRAERIHTFSHQQLFQNEGKDIIVASFILRNEDFGLSLRDLILTVRSALINDAESLIMLERAVRKAGMGNPDEIGPIFDEQEALDNLAWYFVENVPHFPQPEPPGVTNTRYHVDLSTAPKMADEDVKRWLSLLANET